MTDELVMEYPGADTLVIAFGGMAKVFGGILPFEFLKFMKHHFPTISKIFYIDHHGVWYHKGIRGVSHNIDSTVAHLRKKTMGYKRLVFIGVSAGGYAAILFGSLLGVDHVVSFIPQTHIHLTKKHDVRYKDLLPIINKKTIYHLYADTQMTEPIHHIHHCERLEHLPNVHVVRHNGKKIAELRDSGELFTIFKNVFMSYSHS